MYISSFLSLQSGLSGVEAAQEELATTSNNITNANEAGYERESVTLAARPGLNIAAGNAGGGYQLGTGVDASGIVNASNQYLDTAARTQNANTASATTLEGLTNQLQGLLGETNTNSGAISAQLQTFWSDWNSLADNPGNAGAQQSVVEAGQSLADSVNQLASGISLLRGQAVTQYTNITQNAPGGQIHDDVTQLATLNGQIRQATQGGIADNALIDQRNKVLDDLSSLASVTVSSPVPDDGTVNVSFGGITNLVSGTTVNWPSSGATTLGGGGFAFPGSVASVGGKLGALVSFAAGGGTLDSVATQLDGFASQLASSVNALTATSTSGVTQFFSVSAPGAPGAVASSLAVNASLQSNPAQVPTTALGTTGSNDIAVAVSQLAGQAPDTAYAGFVESVGGITREAADNATNQTALGTQISNQRLSAEGVDMNEEMTNLVAEQQAYEASAKVMNAFSTMMNSLMSVVGQ